MFLETLMGEILTKKQQTRRRMIDAASQNFRSKGYAGVGVDGIAKDAGVTSGAFYAHFGSKDGAFSATLDAGLDEVIEAIPEFQRTAGSEWIRTFVDYYIGKRHRDDLAHGCAMTTLSPEVVRAGPEMRAAYEAKMKKIADLVANGLEGSSKEECRSRAWALLGTLIGGLTMARAVKTRKATEEIASAIRAAAVSVAGDAREIA
jgi:AcrR family transcriptional regulator